MSHIDRLSSRTTRGMALLAAVLLLTLSLAVFAPPSADAVPSCGTHKYYYTSPSYTTQVGYRYYDCNGTLITSSGTVTPYVISKRYCCDLEN